MNGKELKVAEYNLTFGSGARMVNVYGVFRYIKNNSLYVIYGDINPVEPVVNYGSSHVNETAILSMAPKQEDEEIIKEYIFKITNDEELKGFEIIPLDKIETIEIIGSNHLELKKEIINNLIDKTMPKKETTETQSTTKGKGKKNNKLLMPLIIILALAGAGYYLYTSFNNNDNTIKKIICKKETPNNSLSATIETTNEYNFNNEDTLEKVEITQKYIFNTTEAYEDFINKGLYYKYMPEDETGGYKEDKENNIITYVSKEYVDENYTESTNYEEVLFQNKQDGYTCEETILK